MAQTDIHYEKIND